MKRVWAVFLALILVLSLGLNVAQVGILSVSKAMAALYDAVTGSVSVVSGLRDTLSNKETDLERLTGERDRLSKEVTRLSDDVAIREGKIAQLTDDIAVRDTRIATLSDEVVDLRRTGSVVYRGQRRLLTEAITDTNERIARRTAVAASRNASSVVAEAIPYLGIAAMLGVTAYDLKDSCDTIKDLHALDVAIDPEKEISAEDTEVCGLRVPTKDEVWSDVKGQSVEAWDAAGRYVPDLPEFKLPGVGDLMFWN